MPLTFNREFEPRQGESVEVAPGVRRVTAKNPGPFTFQGTNTFLIGEDDLAVLDPGPDDPSHVEALLRATGNARVAHILVSHRHADHSSAARALQARTGTPIFAASQRRPFRTDAGLRLDAADDSGFSPDRALTDGAVVEGDGYRLEAIATPGHASDHLAFALADRGILFSGDHVMGWATTVVAPPDGSMRDYMASLDRLLARPEDLYFPAHGGEIRDARNYVRALRAHRKMRERAIIERLAHGDRTIADMVRRIYSDIDPPLRAAAALSTLAHLEDLTERGLVAADSQPSVTANYWLGVSPSSSAGTGSGATGAGVSRSSDS
jgi:glyoxylase-like metal-dependent hydrolase (beta-lactamase superfamily II)